MIGGSWANGHLTSGAEPRPALVARGLSGPRQRTPAEKSDNGSGGASAGGATGGSDCTIGGDDGTRRGTAVA